MAPPHIEDDPFANANDAVQKEIEVIFIKRIPFAQSNNLDDMVVLLIVERDQLGILEPNVCRRGGTLLQNVEAQWNAQIVPATRIYQLLNEEDEDVERIRMLAAVGDLHAQHLINRFDNPEDDGMSIDSSNDSVLQEKMPFEEEMDMITVDVAGNKWIWIDTHRIFKLLQNGKRSLDDCVQDSRLECANFLRVKMFWQIIDIKAKRVKAVLGHIQDGRENAIIEMDKIIKHFGKESMSVMITEKFKLTMLASERAQRFYDQLIDFGKSALQIEESFHGQKIN
ncbi:hypothetical protein DAPPUDRAFT_321949 [Daphnia pulex]|uniref:Uncharacterized protein n=1 Tax=Daphnia pulex TaxID=6669 RepID=E9GUN6_DAPPU|nr:hypothetical protein DAPPUDRAFT_321949 [Daphnia pulex]|eukprot:EFX76762.1 hypothetical protein DAPPUDRAFT_321949 [Daphnia pulex]